MLTYDSLASSCATPATVKLFLGLSAIAGAAAFGVSMWQVTYIDDGDLAGLLDLKGWQEYCDGKEIFDGTAAYVRPFGFNWELADEEGFAACPWTVTNSVYRGIVTIGSFFVGAALFFPSAFSPLGPAAMHLLAVLYFISFVLDAHSLALGNGSCEDEALLLLEALADNGKMECQPGTFVFTLILDIAGAILFMWTGSLWKRVGDIYALQG